MDIEQNYDDGASKKVFGQCRCTKYGVHSKSTMGNRSYAVTFQR